MKRAILTLIMMILAGGFVAEAQTQQQVAIVKTRGRLQSDQSVVEGHRITNATVQIRGGNTMLSDQNGEIRFGVPQNQGFYIAQVTKEGYTISDGDILSTEHRYTNTPLYILRGYRGASSI